MSKLCVWKWQTGGPDTIHSKAIGATEKRRKGLDVFVIFEVSGSRVRHVRISDYSKHRLYDYERHTTKGHRYEDTSTMIKEPQRAHRAEFNCFCH